VSQRWVAGSRPACRVLVLQVTGRSWISNGVEIHASAGDRLVGHGRCMHTPNRPKTQWERLSANPFTHNEFLSSPPFPPSAPPSRPASTHPQPWCPPPCSSRPPRSPTRPRVPPAGEFWLGRERSERGLDGGRLARLGPCAPGRRTFSLFVASRDPPARRQPPLPRLQGRGRSVVEPPCAVARPRSDRKAARVDLEGHPRVHRLGMPCENAHSRRGVRRPSCAPPRSSPVRPPIDPAHPVLRGAGLESRTWSAGDQFGGRRGLGRAGAHTTQKKLTPSPRRSPCLSLLQRRPQDRRPGRRRQPHCVRRDRHPLRQLQVRAHPGVDCVPGHDFPLLQGERRREGEKREEKGRGESSPPRPTPEFLDTLSPRSHPFSLSSPRPFLSSPLLFSPP